MLNTGWVWLLHSNHVSPLPSHRNPPRRISPRTQRGKGEVLDIKISYYSVEQYSEITPPIHFEKQLFCKQLPITVILREGFPQEPNAWDVPYSTNSKHILSRGLHGHVTFCSWPLTRCAFFTPLPKLTTLEAQKLGQAQGRTSQASSYSSMSVEASSCSSMSSISPSKWKGSCQGSAQGGKCPALGTTRGTFSTSRPQWSLHWPGASFLCSARLLCSPMHTSRNKSARAMFSTLTPFCGFSFPTCSTPTSTWGWKAEEFHQSPKSQDRPTFPICQKTTWLWKEEEPLLTTATREGGHIQESRHCQSGGWICQPWHIKLQRKGVQRQEFLKGSQRSRKGCHISFPTFPNSKGVKNQQLLPTLGGKKRISRYGTKLWTTRRRESCFIPDIWMMSTLKRKTSNIGCFEVFYLDKTINVHTWMYIV